MNPPFTLGGLVVPTEQKSPTPTIMPEGSPEDPYAIEFGRPTKRSKTVPEHSGAALDPAQDNKTGNDDGVLQTAPDTPSAKGATKDSCTSSAGKKHSYLTFMHSLCGSYRA